jgi:hypothetical protein
LLLNNLVLSFKPRFQVRNSRGMGSERNRNIEYKETNAYAYSAWVINQPTETCDVNFLQPTDPEDWQPTELSKTKNSALPTIFSKCQR